MAKHSKTSIFNKRLFLIIFLLLIVLILLFIFKIFHNLKPVKKPSDQNTILVLNNQTNDNFVEERKRTVVGADYLEIPFFTLDCSANSSEISVSIKNNSSDNHDDLNLLISFLDDNNNIVATLTCPLKSIGPNEVKHTYGIVNSDLSNCTNYEISLLDE